MKHRQLMIIALLVIMTAFSLSLSAQYWKVGTVNALAGAGTDYQVKFTVHYGNGVDAGENVFLNGHCRSDFADVRFFEGSTQLSYWMESKTDGNSAIFWVKLNGDLSINPILVTVQYGNHSLSNISNGNDTFIFFDDFSGDLSKWTKHKELGGATITIPANEDYVRCGGGTTTDPYGHTVLGSSATYNGFKDNAIEYRYRVCATGISEVGYRGVFGNPGTGQKVRSDARSTPPNTGGQSILTPSYYGWDFLTDAPEDNDHPSAGTWYRGTVAAYGSGIKFYRNGILKRSTALGDVNQIGEISLQNHYGDFSDYDWVAVRKFANAEPTIGSWGDETLPVELSSFTVTISAYHNIVLTWVTQSETGVMGFYVYRGTDPNLVNARQITSLINATNTSDQQVYIFRDNEVNQIGTYYYWLMAADIDGSESFHGPINVVYEDMQPGSPDIPIFTELKQIYPNPFNPDTTINYVLAKSNDISIIIYNVRGQEVRRFERNNVAAGSWKLTWDGKDQNGNGLSSGVYYIRMQAGQDSFMKKAVLMK